MAGKVAIVTGAAQGIGAGVAGYLASLGAAAALVDIDSKLGMQTERRLRNKGLDVTFWECDLRQTSQVTSLVDRIWSGAGRVDVVVNNAAEHGPRRPILDYSIKDWDNVLATNLTGTFDFDLQWTPDQIPGGGRGPIPIAPFDADGPSLFTALQEQLGLRLDAQRGAVDVLVIDAAEKPSAD